MKLFHTIGHLTHLRLSDHMNGRIYHELIEACEE